jgi:hypothetical protein
LAALRDGCWLVVRWAVLRAALRDGCWLVVAPGRAAARAFRFLAFRSVGQRFSRARPDRCLPR